MWAHERTELIAMDVFERAQDAGETITRAMVDHRLDELRFARQVGQGPRDD